MEAHLSKISLTRREQPETLQSHWLVPVLINERGPFRFALEISRARTLISATTLENLGIGVDFLDEAQATIPISEKLAYALIRLDSLKLGDAEVRDFEVVVWGKPIIDKKSFYRMKPNVIHALGNHPQSPIDSVVECRGVLGADFLSKFTVSFDLNAQSVELRR